MVAAVRDLLEALSSVGVTIEAHEDSLRYRPASAMTPDLLAAVKSFKADLLELLNFPGGLGAGSHNSVVLESTPAPDTPVRSISQTTRLGDDPMVDDEFRRFARVARPMADGDWYCPVYGSSTLPVGISGEDWQRFIDDCGRMGKAVRALKLGEISTC